MVSSEAKNIDLLFHPKSIAIIGASPKAKTRANQWIRAFMHLNYQGKLFPINPKADHIMAYKSYPSILDVPDDIDLAIFSVPFQVVIPVMKDCVKKKSFVKKYIVYTPFFKKFQIINHKLYYVLLQYRLLQCLHFAPNS